MEKSVCEPKLDIAIFSRPRFPPLLCAIASVVVVEIFHIADRSRTLSPGSRAHNHNPPDFSLAFPDFFFKISPSSGKIYQLNAIFPLQVLVIFFSQYSYTIPFFYHRSFMQVFRLIDPHTYVGKFMKKKNLEIGGLKISDRFQPNCVGKNWMLSRMRWLVRILKLNHRMR